jgi:ribokinase
MATDAEVVGVRDVFLKLRTRAGLTAERLQGTEVDTGILAGLPVIQRAMRDTGVSADQAIVAVVTAAVAELDPTDRLIADVVLALGVLRDRFGARPDLYEVDLGERRAALVAGWAALHEQMGAADVPPAPTVRSLRGTVEKKILGVLAERCVHSRAATGRTNLVHSQRSNTVVVLGSAVMDHVTVVESLPTARTSVQATSFDVNPGGKGLILAVGGARMGLDVRLATAIGGDAAADTLLDYMRSEGLSTELVKSVPGEITPVAQVIVLPNGDAAAIGWKNELRVALSTRDLRRQEMRKAMDVADAVLVTLEVPVDVVKWTLDNARRLPNQPLVLLQASPPLPNPQQIYAQLPGVDYVVGSRWALRRLLAEDKDLSVDDIARRLINMGVTTVCVVENLSCHIRSRELDADIDSPPVALTDAPGAREVFSAALVHRLLAIGRALTRESLEWACAAMAVNLSLDIITDATPTADEVRRLMRSDDQSASSAT